MADAIFSKDENGTSTAHVAIEDGKLVLTVTRTPVENTWSSQKTTVAVLAFDLESATELAEQIEDAAYTIGLGKAEKRDRTK